jgi:hypothetical protein
VSVSIPSQYRSYVTAAANALGVPEQLVAAQIETESSWNPHALSPAGAEGIAQFEPGTFASYGPKGGSPYNVKDAFAAYTSYMSALLKQEGGSIRKALEAYNAGPGNLGAGAGYATMIMEKAGVLPDTKAGPAGRNAASDGGGIAGAVGSLLSFPSEITGFFTSAGAGIAETAQFFGAFFQPSTYVRIGAGLLGFMLLGLGIVTLGMSAAKE